MPLVLLALTVMTRPHIEISDHLEFLAVSEDAKLALITNSKRGEIVVWDLAAWKELSKLKAGATIRSIGFAGNSAFFTAGYDGKVSIRTLPGGAVTTEWKLPSFAAGPAVARGAALIINHGAGGTFTLAEVELQTGKQRRVFDAEKQETISLALSPDGKKLLSSHRKGPVRLWSSVSGKRLIELPAESATAVAFGDGDTLVTSTFQQETVVWDAATGRELRRFERFQSGGYAISVSPNGKQVLSAGLNTLRVMELDTGRERVIDNAHQGEIVGVRFLSNGRAITIGGMDCVLKLWDTERGVAVKTTAIATPHQVRQ